MLVAAGRTLVPNDYVVELGGSDADRLEAYDLPLRRELAAMIDEHAVEQGWSFVGPVAVRFERVADLRTGMFRVRSAVVVADVAVADVVVADVAPAPRGDGAPAVPASPVPCPMLLLGDRQFSLEAAVTVIGRGAEADLRLLDAGVSRRHVEVRRSPDGSVVLVDAGSTNGTLVNNRSIVETPLTDGDQSRVGDTTLTFRMALVADDGPPRTAHDWPGVEG